MHILIVDDHAMLRGGLRRVLADEIKGLVIGEAGDAPAALAAVLKRSWDLVLLDITLPGRNGLDLLKDLKQHRPRLPVLVLSMHPERQYAIRALRSGAAGYLTKTSAPTELLRAVQHILAGGRYVSTALAEQLAAELANPTLLAPHERLSDREFEVLRRIASGKTQKALADEMRLSVTTISTYRARILAKLQVGTTAEMIRYALDHKLVE